MHFQVRFFNIFCRFQWSLKCSFSEIPVAENFAFSFNTLLSDVAKCCPSFREGIFEAQTELLVTLAKQVEDQINDQANMTQDKKRK